MIYGPFSLVDIVSGNISFDLWIETQPADNSNYFDYLFCGFSTDGQHFTGFKTAGVSGDWMFWSHSFADFASGITLPGEAEVWLGFGFISDASTEAEVLDGFPYSMVHDPVPAGTGFGASACMAPPSIPAIISTDLINFFTGIL